MKTILLFLTLFIFSCAPKGPVDKTKLPFKQVTLAGGHFETCRGPIIYLPGGLIKFKNIEGDTIVAGGTFWIESFH